MEDLEQIMQEHQMEMEELESLIKEKEKEQNRPPMSKYGRAILRHIQETDMERYIQLLVFENLFERILEREAQAQTRLRTLITQQEELEKVEEIEDYMEKVAVRQRIQLEVDSIVMREIVLKPM